MLFSSFSPYFLYVFWPTSSLFLSYSLKIQSSVLHLVHPSLRPHPLHDLEIYSPFLKPMRDGRCMSTCAYYERSIPSSRSQSSSVPSPFRQVWVEQPFLYVVDNVYEYIISFFSLIYHVPPWRKEVGIHYFILGVPTRFSLSTLFDILNFPNEGSRIWTTVNDSIRMSTHNKEQTFNQF